MNGNTPLHVACREGHYNVATYLIRARADVTIKSMVQKTAFQLCKEINMQDNLKGKRVILLTSISTLMGSHYIDIYKQIFPFYSLIVFFNFFVLVSA